VNTAWLTHYCDILHYRFEPIADLSSTSQFEWFTIGAAVIFDPKQTLAMTALMLLHTGHQREDKQNPALIG